MGCEGLHSRPQYAIIGEVNHMPKFTYKVKELSGEETTGESEALDRFKLAADLRSQGKTIISVEEIKKETFSILLMLCVSTAAMYSAV